MRKTFFIIIGLSLVFLIVSVGSALRESLTFDEVVHIQEGLNAWNRHTFAIDTNNPPFIREIQVIPLLLHFQIFPARLITIFFGMLLLTLIFFTTKKYFGLKIATFAGFLYVFEPTILGNSHYITQDIGITLLFFATYQVFLWMHESFSFQKLFLFSILLGLSCASKITFIPFFLFTILLFGLYVKKKKLLQAIWLKRNLIVVSFGIYIVVIWVTYFFKTNVIIVKRQDTGRVSVKLQQFATKTHNTFLTNTLYFLQKQPIPLGDYIGVLKNISVRSFTARPSCFFLGKTYAKCLRYFIFGNLLLKLPLPILIFFIVGLSSFVTKKTKKEKYLFLPLLGITIAVILFPLDPKVRYILPLYPFILIAAAISFPFWTKTVIKKCLFVFLLVWYLATSLSSFPHFISYANELAFGQKQFLLIDSNMDWGQSLPDAKNYMTKQSISHIEFSYFGRDNGDLYGLKSNKPYGSYKSNEICAFHTINTMPNGANATLMSVTNWYTCGYNTDPQFARSKIKAIVGESIFVF